VLALADNFSCKPRCCLVTSDLGDVGCDLHEIIARAVEKPEAGRSNGFLEALSDGTAHVVSAVVASMRNRILKGFRRAARFASLMACAIASSGVAKWPFAISSLSQAS
jgi:hypothetical protein